MHDTRNRKMGKTNVKWAQSSCRWLFLVLNMQLNLARVSYSVNFITIKVTIDLWGSSGENSVALGVLIKNM